MTPKGKRRALYEMFDASDPGSRSVPQSALRRPHMHQPESRVPASTGPATAPPADPSQSPLRRAEPAPMTEPKIAPRPVREDGGFPLAPGKSVRVPSGYLFFGSGLLIALLIAAFALGYARGERAAEIRIAGDLRQGENPDIVEPLNGTPSTRTQQTQPQPQAQPTTRTTRPTGQRQPTTPAAPSQPTRTPGGALVVTRDNADPRTPGENYLFVALRGPEEAVEIAEFLTANGVNAAVFDSNRPTLRQVVALRGFPPDAIRGQNSNEYQRFRQNIRDLGREWATRTRGSQNFDDLYPVRYNP